MSYDDVLSLMYVFYFGALEHRQRWMMSCSGQIKINLCDSVMEYEKHVRRFVMKKSAYMSFLYIALEITKEAYSLY